MLGVEVEHGVPVQQRMLGVASAVSARLPPVMATAAPRATLPRVATKPRREGCSANRWLICLINRSMAGRPFCLHRLKAAYARIRGDAAGCAAWACPARGA